MVEQVTFQTLFQFLQTVGILVGVFYYIMTIRTNQRNQEIAQKNQELALKAQEQALETRQAQMFMGIYNQLNRADFIDATRTFRETEWSTFEEYQQILGDSELDSRHLWVLGMFYEGLGVLVKNDLVPMKLIAETMTGSTRLWWEKFIPIIEDGRREMNRPRWFRETEYLYNELMKYLEEHPELKT